MIRPITITPDKAKRALPIVDAIAKGGRVEFRETPLIEIATGLSSADMVLHYPEECRVVMPDGSIFKIEGANE